MLDNVLDTTDAAVGVSGAADWAAGGRREPRGLRRYRRGRGLFRAEHAI